MKRLLNIFVVVAALFSVSAAVADVELVANGRDWVLTGCEADNGNQFGYGRLVEIDVKRDSRVVLQGLTTRTQDGTGTRPGCFKFTFRESSGNRIVAGDNVVVTVYKKGDFEVHSRLSRTVPGRRPPVNVPDTTRLPEGYEFDTDLFGICLLWKGRTPVFGEGLADIVPHSACASRDRRLLPQGFEYGWSSNGGCYLWGTVDAIIWTQQVEIVEVGRAYCRAQ